MNKKKLVLIRTISIFLAIIFITWCTNNNSKYSQLLTPSNGQSEKGLINKNKTEIKISDEWETPVNLWSPINSEKWEDAPSISPNGNILYFTIGEWLHVDSYSSEKINGKWSNPKPHSFNLPDFPDWAVHTQDNKTLYFASVRPGTIGSGDIYVFKNNDIKNIGSPINTKELESEPYISKDGNTLFFASKRDNGFGGDDIWFSKKLNGKWQEPENIGFPVNSKLNETQPFITDDGQELYFTATNKDWIGGPAIFKSSKVKNSWSKPELVVSGFVGEPTLTADKNKLYFVHIFRNKGKLLNADIYVAEKK